MMLSNFTAEIFTAFLNGTVALLVGGYLFENGKKYVKTGGSNEFKGKFAAFGVLLVVLLFGEVIQQLDPIISDIVYQFSPSVRLGIMTVGTMLLVNYIVDNYNYDDKKSIIVYFIVIIVGALPYLSST